MEVDHDDLVAIVGESKTRLKKKPYKHCGTSIDLYKFSNKQTGHWKTGRVFYAHKSTDLSFHGVIGDINANDKTNTREASFLVHEPNQQRRVEDMMVRSSRLRHLGVLKPCIAGFNTQITKVVSAFSKPTSSLAEWLTAKSADGDPHIPVDVQKMIRTGYQAIELIWEQGSTSDDLASIESYVMIDNKIKINPFFTRRKEDGDNDKMVLRSAFGQMIHANIYNLWPHVELQDFIDLLGNSAASETDDVLGHPVLLPPTRRELMYHEFDTTPLGGVQGEWFGVNADPGADWKVRAGTEDEALNQILLFQQHHGGFHLNAGGALHFASVVTGHYIYYYKTEEADNWRQGIKGRVDMLLKKVLPGLISKRYNAKYHVAPQV